VPPPAIRELRDLTRYRTVLMQERARVANRLHRVLEDAGIKLATVASNIVGVSGRAMLEALVGGTTDPALLAELARGTLRKKLPALRAALAGHFRGHHGFLVSQHLAHLDFLDESVATVSAQLEGQLRPFAAALARLQTIPGIHKRGAEVLVAEIGIDMRRFPTAGHLASWAGLCPGQHESAGKRKPTKARKGNRWLRSQLVLAAKGAIRSQKGGALAARYRRLLRHRGHPKALVGAAHALLVAAYHVLLRETDYHDLGATYLDVRAADRAKRRAVRLLEQQGYSVTLTPAAA
jgi:transposase